MANGGLLFVVPGYILWAADRFCAPPDVASAGTLVVTVIGLVVNLIAMRLLKAGSGDSLNVKGAYLEVWADMLGSVGVIVGALVIQFTGFGLVDPIIAVLIGLWVLPRTWLLLRDAGHVLMQGVPEGLKLDQLRKRMLDHPDVGKVHDLHAWALGSKESVVTAHIVLRSAQEDVDQVRQFIMGTLQDEFGITHATLQVEETACADSHGQARAPDSHR